MSSMAERVRTNQRFPTSLAWLDFIDWNRVGLISGSPTDVQAEFVYQLPGWLMSSDKGLALVLISDVHRPLRPLKRPYLRRDRAIRPPWADLIALTSSAWTTEGLRGVFGSSSRIVGVAVHVFTPNNLFFFAEYLTEIRLCKQSSKYIQVFFYAKGSVSKNYMLCN